MQSIWQRRDHKQLRLNFPDYQNYATSLDLVANLITLLKAMNDTHRESNDSTENENNFYKFQVYLCLLKQQQHEDTVSV